MLTIEQASRQVFGLAGYLLTPASQSMAEPVLMLERSFLLTAAGQFRSLTGFPFKPDLATGHREVIPVYRRLCNEKKATGLVIRAIA